MAPRFKSSGGVTTNVTLTWPNLGIRTYYAHLGAIDLNAKVRHILPGAHKTRKTMQRPPTSTNNKVIKPSTSTLGYMLCYSSS